MTRASRGPGAIASRDDAPRGRMGLGANALKTTSLKVIASPSRMATTQIIAKLIPGEEVTTTDSRSNVSAAARLGVPNIQLFAPTRQVLAPSSGKVLFPQKGPAPQPAPTRATPPAPTPSNVTNTSVEPIDQTCPPSYFLSGEKCLPVAMQVQVNGATGNEGVTPGLTPKGQSCPGGYYLDSAGRWCRPVEQFDATGLPLLQAMSSIPAKGTSSTPNGGATTSPVSRGGGGARDEIMYGPTVESAAVPVGPPSSGISLTQILLFGGLGLGALYFLTRKK